MDTPQFEAFKDSVDGVGPRTRTIALLETTHNGEMRMHWSGNGMEAVAMLETMKFNICTDIRKDQVKKT